MERLLIIGFGAAGHIEAAAVVVAAKGILRFPELQAAALEMRQEPFGHQLLGLVIRRLATVARRLG